MYFKRLNNDLLVFSYRFKITAIYFLYNEGKKYYNQINLSGIFANVLGSYGFKNGLTLLFQKDKFMSLRVKTPRKFFWMRPSVRNENQFFNRASEAVASRFRPGCASVWNSSNGNTRKSNSAKNSDRQWLWLSVCEGVSP